MWFSTPELYFIHLLKITKMSWFKHSETSNMIYVLNYICSLKCFRPLWTWFTQTYRHNVLHKTFENMKWARIMMIYIYLNRKRQAEQRSVLKSAWFHDSGCNLAKKWQFLLQPFFGQVVRITNLKNLQAQKIYCFYESVSAAIQSDKSVLLSIIIIIIIVILLI